MIIQVRSTYILVPRLPPPIRSFLVGGGGSLGTRFPLASWFATQLHWGQFDSPLPPRVGLSYPSVLWDDIVLIKIN